MGIKSRIEEKAMETQQTLAAHAQMKYIQWLMKEEECDYEEALAIVQGSDDRDLQAAWEEQPVICSQEFRCNIDRGRKDPFLERGI